MNTKPNIHPVFFALFECRSINASGKWKRRHKCLSLRHRGRFIRPVSLAGGIHAPAVSIRKIFHFPFSIFHLIAILSLLVSCTNEPPEIDNETLLLTTIQVPEYPAMQGDVQGRIAVDPQGKCTWQPGDVLYLVVVDDNSSTIVPGTQTTAHYQAGGLWTLSSPIPAQGQGFYYLYATYIGTHQPGEAVADSDFLQNATPLTPGHTHVSLNNFRRDATHLRFEGLRPGDVVTFGNTSSWRAFELRANWYNLSSVPIPPLTANDEGVVDAYVSLFVSNADYHFTITRGTHTTGQLVFKPGDPNPDGNYANRRYRIHCGGYLTDLNDDDAAPALERARFLAWADKIRNDDFSEPNFTLACDIDLTDIDFQPITDQNTTFYGIFDGGGHTITGLTIDCPSDDSGLFACVNGTVKDVHLRGASIRGKRTGGIAGQNVGEILGCTVSGQVEADGLGNNETGGIVGLNSSTIAACSFQGTVSASGTSTPSGGIVGYNNGTLTGCYSATTTVTGSQTGGVAGRHEVNATVSTCHWLHNGTEGIAAGVGYGNGTFTGAPFTGAPDLYIGSPSLVDQMNDALANKGISHRWAAPGGDTNQYPVLSF